MLMFTVNVLLRIFRNRLDRKYVNECHCLRLESSPRKNGCQTLCKQQKSFKKIITTYSRLQRQRLTSKKVSLNTMNLIQRKIITSYTHSLPPQIKVQQQQEYERDMLQAVCVCCLYTEVLRTLKYHLPTHLKLKILLNECLRLVQYKSQLC